MQHPQKGRYERVSPIAIVHRRNPCPFLKFLYLFVVTSCGLWEFLIQRKELILLTYFIIFSTCQPRLCQRVIGPSSLLEPEPWYVIIKGIFWRVCVIVLFVLELFDTASASRRTPTGFERVSSMQHPQKGRYERVSPIAIVHRRNIFWRVCVVILIVQR